MRKLIVIGVICGVSLLGWAPAAPAQPEKSLDKCQQTAGKALKACDPSVNLDLAHVEDDLLDADNNGAGSVARDRFYTCQCVAQCAAGPLATPLRSDTVSSTRRDESNEERQW